MTTASEWLRSGTTAPAGSTAAVCIQNLGTGGPVIATLSVGDAVATSADAIASSDSGSAAMADGDAVAYAASSLASEQP